MRIVVKLVLGFPTSYVNYSEVLRRLVIAGYGLWERRERVRSTAAFTITNDSFGGVKRSLMPDIN